MVYLRKNSENQQFLAFLYFIFPDLFLILLYIYLIYTTMKLPFDTGQFLNVFKTYNDSVFPLQLIFNIAAIVVIGLVFSKFNKSNLIITYVLAFFWLWMGIVYHIIFFSKINNAASVFGILFIIQGLLFIYYGQFKKSFSFGFKSGLQGYAGIIIICYSLAVYPLLGYAAGHVYPQSPTFGLPCPTTIFTFGILLWTAGKIPASLIIIPFIWSVIGFFAAVYLGIFEDTGLLVSGVLAFCLLLFNKGLTIRS